MHTFFIYLLNTMLLQKNSRKGVLFFTYSEYSHLKSYIIIESHYVIFFQVYRKVFVWRESLESQIRVLKKVIARKERKKGSRSFGLRSWYIIYNWLPLQQLQCFRTHLGGKWA